MTAHDSYRLAAIYPDECTAVAALDTVLAAMAGDILAIGLTPDARDIDRAIGAPATAGTGTDAAGTTIAAEVYVAAQVVAPLIVLGYGSVLDATAGDIQGLQLSERDFRNLVKDALRADFRVVILHTASASARRRAATVLDATLPGH